MAPLIVRVLAVSVFAAVLQFHIVTSASLERREFFAGQLTLPPEPEHSCESYVQPYCHCFNPNDRKHALFPNPRRQNAAEAQTEFRDFVNITKSNCSNKIGGLLCFFYFPFCSSNIADPEVLLPCREDCEEVRRECEDEFVSRGFPWPEHLTCSKDYFQPKSTSNCIPLGSDPAQGYDACVLENTNATTSTTRPTVATTDPTRETTAPTEVTDPTPRTPEITNPVGPRVPECNLDECVRCSKRFRTNCNKGTFKKNDYTWAAHMQVVRSSVVDGYKAYVVRVIKQYLPDPEDGLRMEEYTVVKTTSATCCSECLNDRITDGTEYLLSGHHTTDPLTLTLDVRNCLASEWSSKYTRSLDNWITNARS